MTYHLSAVSPFRDIETGAQVHPSDTVETESLERTMNMLRLGVASLKGIKHPERPGARIMVHQKYCFKIGGIETANQQIAKAFEGRNITFVFGSGDINQMLALGEHHNVWIDNGRETYDTDVLIMTNYDSAPEILDRVRARKIYQQIHADFEALTQMKEWQSFSWRPNPRVDKVLAVSETAQKGLKARFGVDSIVVPNILAPLPKDHPMRFLWLSRATPEKGADRLVQLLKRFDDASKDYILFLCSSIEQASRSEQIYLRENPRVITVQPTPYAKELIRACDMLIQLSYNESYCYSVREALQLGKPCLVSDCAELSKLIKDGENGFIWSEGMDIDKLFHSSLKPKPLSEKVSPLWEKVLNGEL